MNRLTLVAFAVSSFGIAGFSQQTPDSPSWRLLRATETEQRAAVAAALDRGLTPTVSGPIGILLLNRNNLVIPMVEAKMEQVIKGSCRASCFTDTSVNPNHFLVRAAGFIADSGDVDAIEAMSKLILLDEARFEFYIGMTLTNAVDYSKSHNPFVVAYHGLDLENPALNKAIMAWVTAHVSVDPEERKRAEWTALHLRMPPTPPPSDRMRQLWAEAMVNRYGVAPTETQWWRDPIASRLSPPLAEQIRPDVLRFSKDAFEAGKRK